MTIPYISSADLGTHLGTDLSASAAATIAIDSACEAVRTFTRRKLNLTEDEEIVLNGSGTETLLLPNWPVVEVTSVDVDDVETTDYIVAGSRLVRTDDGIWDRGVGNVALVYSHGYAVDEGDVNGAARMPTDLRRVTLELAARIFLGSGVGTDDVQESANGPGPTSLTETDRADLMPYRDLRVG